MSIKYSFAQSGIPLECQVGSDANFGTLGGFSALVDGAFALCVDLRFGSNAANTFFGGAGTGSRALYLQRNAGSSRDSSITFTSTDASGDVRTVKWAGAVENNRWKTCVFNSSGLGADNLNLYVDGSLKAITSQTNDAGFNADEAFDLSFGEVSAGVIAPFDFTTLYVYNRALTASEIAQISLGVYPSGYVRGYSFPFPNIGVNRTLLTPVVN